MSARDEADELHELKALLRDHCEEYVETLEGAPPSQITRDERRWGNNGARSLVTAGHKRGRWFDYDSWTGGSLIDATMLHFSYSTGEAIRYAKRYFGIEDDEREQETRVSLPIPPDVIHAREQKRIEEEAAAETDIQRRIAFARRLAAESVPITNTVAERYLTEIRKVPASRWPECLRYHRRSNSLLAIVTTPAGEVQAVHRIYLDTDGRKLPKEELARRDLPARGKQTHGSQAGAAVRLPGPDDGPLLLGEGVETVLSVWAVCGIETWATLGKIPTPDDLPKGRRVFWLQDDDKDHSPRDKSIRRAIREWRRAGIHVTLAPPWRARRYNKADWNDLLKQEGPDAVRTHLDTIVNQKPPPPPPRTSLDLAQRTAAHAIGGFFRAAERFDAAVAEANRRAPPVHAAHVDVGTGKSHLARAEAVALVKRLRAQGDARAVFVGVPTHVLADEQVEQILPGLTDAGLKVAVWRGQSAADPDNPGKTMCCELEMLRTVQALYLDPMKTSCAVCAYGPNKKGTCSSLAQKDKRADIWLGAHNLLFERKPAAIGDVAAIVVDENPLNAALEGHEPGHPIRLSLDTLRREDDAGNDTGELRELRSQVVEILDAHPDGPLRREVFETACFSEQMARDAVRMEWATQIEPDIHPRMDKAAFYAALAEAAPNGDLGRRVRFWRSLGELLLPTGPEKSGWLALVTKHDEKGARREIELKGRRAVKEGWVAPTLVLDATLRPELLRHIWPRLEVVACAHVRAPHQRIRQVIDRAYSLTMLDVDDAKDDKERAHRLRNLKSVHAIIVREARRYAPGRVLIVPQKRIKEALQQLAWVPNNVQWGHHNGIRGIDRWKDVRLLIIIGRTLPPANAVARAAEALTGAAIEKRDYEKVTAYREMADGSTATVEAWKAPDPIAEAIRWQVCEGELVQVGGRSRGVWRTEDNPVEILAMTDIPLPLPVHELIGEQDLDPSQADKMLAAGGVCFTNSSHAYQAYPDLWPSLAAARKAMQRAKIGEVATEHLARVDYVLAGPRQRSGTAFFDPELVPNITATLSERLGEMLCHRLIPSAIRGSRRSPARKAG